MLGINDDDGFDDYHPRAPEVPRPVTRPRRERDGCRCWMCGVELLLRREQSGHPLYATLDHVVPRSRGGSFEIDNLRLACRSCNNRRGDRPADDPLPGTCVDAARLRGSSTQATLTQ